MTDSTGTASIDFSASAASALSSYASGNPEGTNEEFTLSISSVVETAPVGSFAFGAVSVASSAKPCAVCLSSCEMARTVTAAAGGRVPMAVSASPVLAPSATCAISAYSASAVEGTNAEFLSVFSVAVTSEASGSFVFPTCAASASLRVTSRCLSSWSVAYGVTCSAAPSSIVAASESAIELDCSADSELSLFASALPVLLLSCSASSWSGFIIGRIEAAVWGDYVQSKTDTDYLCVAPGADYLYCYTECEDMIYQGSRVYLYIEPMACPTTRGGSHTPAETSPIVVTVTSPSGVVTTPDALQTETSTQYYSTWYADEPGEWRWKVSAGTESLGTVRASLSGRFIVLPVA